METPRRMVIDEVATILGTERRRVYDIINVLESLNMAARVQKNMYQWMGKLYLEETLGRLKAIAIKLNLRAKVKALHVTKGEKNFKVGQERIRFDISLYVEKKLKVLPSFLTKSVIFFYQITTKIEGREPCPPCLGHS